MEPRLTKYIAQTPMPKQRLALCLPARELFFGGAAGGGKSSWLLMAALQYVDIPHYAALIIRTSLRDADNPGSVLFRSREWLGGRDDVLWNAKRTAWHFPSGAVLQFGYLGQKNDKYQYDSAEYQFVGFDEVTHQKNEEDYEYLFTRQRGPRCRRHSFLANKSLTESNLIGRQEGCEVCQYIFDTGRLPLMHVPLRMFAASNPGGPGHYWVQERFQIEAIPGKKTPGGRQLYAGTHPDRPYIPSFLEDNQYIDQEGYRHSITMGVRDEVTKYQKLAGDWGIRSEGRFKRDWIHRYRLEGSYITLLERAFLIDKCYQFIMIDPAASRKNAPGDKSLTTKQASYTAISRWLVTPEHDLCLMACNRYRCEAPEVSNLIRAAQGGWPVSFVGMEYTAMSIHLYTILQGRGFPMKAIKPRSQDKIQRSLDAATRMEDGKLWLPQPGPKWVQEYEDEVFSWKGDPDEIDDQVDVTSYAALYLSENPLPIRGRIPEVV